MFWSKQNDTVLVEDGHEMCGKVMDRGIVEVTGWPAPARGLMRVIQNKTYEQPKSATSNAIRYTTPQLSVVDCLSERIGLVSLCVEDADLQKTALDVAEDLSNGAQSAIRWTKYALNNWLRINGPLFDTSTALEILGFTGAEAREELASHLEKRKPVFPQDCPI